MIALSTTNDVNNERDTMNRIVIAAFCTLLVASTLVADEDTNTTVTADETNAVVETMTASADESSTTSAPMAQATELGGEEVTPLGGTGIDATNCYFSAIQPIVVNGTNAVQVTAFYPSSWSSGMQFEISSDVTQPIAWQGVGLDQQVVHKRGSSTGELPKWTTWTVSMKDVIGPRFFRVKQL